MSCMRNDMLKEAAVMYVDPDWIISSHSLLKVRNMGIIEHIIVDHAICVVSYNRNVWQREKFGKSFMLCQTLTSQILAYKWYSND